MNENRLLKILKLNTFINADIIIGTNKIFLLLSKQGSHACSAQVTTAGASTTSTFFLVVDAFLVVLGADLVDLHSAIIVLLNFNKLHTAYLSINRMYK